MLQIIARADLVCPEDRRTAIYETLGLINEQLWMGHFELWSADGTVLFRHATLLDTDEDEDEPDLTIGQAEVLVEAAVDEFERFYPVFQLVMFADRSRRRDGGGAAGDGRRSVTAGMTAPIWLLGCGNMGGALLRRWLAEDMGPVAVIDPAPRGAAGRRGGQRRCRRQGAPDVLVLAVKPQVWRAGGGAAGRHCRADDVDRLGDGRGDAADIASRLSALGRSSAPCPTRRSASARG